MNAIASRAGLPKANVHYYFNSKLGLYVEVMRHILELWDTAFDDLTVDDDPATALAEYIRIKMEFRGAIRKPRRSSPWKSSAAANACPSTSTRTIATGSAAAPRYSTPGSPPARWTRSTPCT